MKLYYHPGSRALRVRWLLEELELRYELQPINLKEGEHKTAEYKKIHPLGVVPALEDADQIVLESTAICMYLVDRYADRGLAPSPGSRERGPYYQWMTFVENTLVPAFFKLLRENRRDPQDAEALAKAKAEVDERLGLIQAQLTEESPFLLGRRFSAADIMVGQSLFKIKEMGVLQEGFPGLESYIEGLQQRPAFLRANAPVEAQPQEPSPAQASEPAPEAAEATA